MSKKVICVSGGFDPVHIGHLRMMQEAAKYGRVIAIVNSDDWLMRKKGYIFMPFAERCEILEGFKCVYDTTTYVQGFASFWPPGPGPRILKHYSAYVRTYFANGGDRKSNNTPEMKVCEKLRH